MQLTQEARLQATGTDTTHADHDQPRRPPLPFLRAEVAITNTMLSSLIALIRQLQAAPLCPSHCSSSKLNESDWISLPAAKDHLTIEPG